MPTIRDTKHGPPPSVYPNLYCRTCGWVTLPDGEGTLIDLHAEHDRIHNLAAEKA